MPYCTHCGSEVTEAARICPNCNRELRRSDSAPPSTSQTPLSPDPPEVLVSPQAQPPPPQTPYQPGSQAPQTDAGAVWALVLGIAGVLVCPGILSIPAIIIGRISERRIKESGGTLTGDGLAKAGWITGIAGLVLAVFLILFFSLIATSFLGSNVPMPEFR